jgi:5-hydroxyisourate hydrolase-like protein (transthyretin family)
MRLSVLAAIGALMVCFSAPASSQEAAKGSLSGIVVQAGTGTPVADVQVSISGNNAGDARTYTGNDGRFVLRDLAPGKYTVRFARSGYVTQQYGERLAPATATPLPLTVPSGEDVDTIVMELTPAGVVSGRIRDRDSGQPAVGMPVDLLAYIHDPFGRKVVQSIGRGTTDDRGKYRIYGIPPGQYFLSAGGSPRPPNRTEDLNLNEVPSDLEITFYPGTADLDRARALRILPGAELRGLDIVPVPPRAFRISGRVVGNIEPEMMVDATREPADLYRDYSNAKVDSNGTFEVTNLPPGDYLLKIEAEGQRASARVHLGESDLKGIELALRTAGTLNGTVLVEDGPLRPNPRIYVRLVDESEETWASAQVDPKGAFTIEKLPFGSYRLILQYAGQPGVYLKAVTYDGVEVASSRWNFDSGKTAALQILASSSTATLRGRIDDSRGRPIMRATVVLIPDSNRNYPELYFVAVTNENGEFEMTGVRPGNYKAFSWESIERYSWLDPMVQLQFESEGIPVRLEESGNVKINLRALGETKP